MTATATVSDVRLRLADYLGRAVGGVPTVITRNGLPGAALVPIADFEALEAASDAALAKEAEAVLARSGPTATMAESVTALWTDRAADTE
ncbi:type II toxin-antitoxin system Phd/YefM family antitoxin [Streptomyces sp. NPDC005576]|uniref:type II toxin-antitoxin system Phd/YefM family antitoxin n=1 Tax=unclassified Streptomyces TaxID=2593676 RepID=UPI0033CAF60B